MISVRARAIRFVSKQIMQRIKPDSDVQEVRRSFERMQARNRKVHGVSVRATRIGGVDCEWLVPDGCDDAPVLYYLHGGAYIMGSPRTHRKMVSHIAKRAGVRALLPDYALAPEKPFPAGLNDCLLVYRALLGSGIEADDILIGGDSAGGGMAMATMLSLKDSGDDLPATAVLLSPWLDLTAQGDSTVTRAADDPWFSASGVRTVARQYCPEGELTNPLVSPVFADASGLPPMLVQVGDHEILLSDSTRLAGNIKNANGEITLQIWPEMWHVFQFFIGSMPESRRAIDDIAIYIREKMAVS